MEYKQVPEKAGAGREAKDDEEKERHTLAEILTGEKDIVGLLEKVRVVGSKGAVEATAIFDTGATRSSVDMKLAAQAGLGPIVRIVKVKSQTDPKGYIRRPMVRGKIEVRGRVFPVEMTLADREEMAHPVLLGRDVIHSHFVVDPEHTHQSNLITDVRPDAHDKARV